MSKLLLFGLLTLIGFSAASKDVYKIEIGDNYERYSEKELRRRIWQLERAVAQLQQQVFQLAINNQNNNGNSVGMGGALWTCQISAFTDTFVASGTTKASALAQVLKKCGDKSNPMHCPEDKAKCGND